jgi:hypothetical protein
MLLVGSNVGIGKSIVDFVPVPLLALLHFVIAMALLWPLVRVSRLRHVKRDEWFNLLLLALFVTFGFTLPMLGGVQRTSAVAAGGHHEHDPRGRRAAFMAHPQRASERSGTRVDRAGNRRGGCHQSRSRGSERGRRDIVHGQCRRWRREP